MTPIIAIRALPHHVGEIVTLRGWVYNIRTSGKIAFLQLRDGSGFTQIIMTPKDVGEACWALIDTLTLESAIICTGTVAQHPKREEYELHGHDVTLVHRADEYPIGKKEHGPDFLLDHRHLWLRSGRQWAIQRVRDTIIRATYDHLHREGFIKIDAPILTPAACEGTTTLFAVPYFDMGSAYLTQSGQLYLEAAIAAHGRVFDFGPVFRAEKSKTRRHLTEFWMMDAEAAFVEHDENLAIQERLICALVAAVLSENRTELHVLERDIAPLERVTPPFPRITHAEAVTILQGKGSTMTAESDLGGEDEALIMENYDRPLFIEKYPARIKAFYMKRAPETPALALCADLIAPEGFGEIVGGSQREDDYNTLLTRIREHQLPVEAFGWYLDLRRYGSVPHSGFGYGLERIVGWLCGVHHVRETIPFPRLLNRLTP
ncbi:MAG: asparagine--tRNA ligase [Deltaproteobacteria bacterium]|nr:asparagine--tRNA ligase [Deltaproteobacteria bacterium]